VKTWSKFEVHLLFYLVPNYRPKNALKFCPKTTIKPLLFSPNTPTAEIILSDSEILEVFVHKIATFSTFCLDYDENVHVHNYRMRNILKKFINNIPISCDLRDFVRKKWRVSQN
jgi:hypothetical protein